MMASIYGYIRVSTQEQARSGLGLAAQKRHIEECAKTLRRKVTRIYRDAGVSASRVPLLKRTAGRELDGVIVAGDHIIIAKLDRAFRSLQDFAHTLATWERRGALVHLLDIGIDTSSHVGKLVAGILASVAEWESRRIGTRIKDAHAERRAQGRKTNGTTAIGWKAVRKRMKPDHRERKIARRIWRMRKRGMAWGAIAEQLNFQKVRRRGGGEWRYDACLRWGIAAKHRFPLTGYRGVDARRMRSRMRPG